LATKRREHSYEAGSDIATVLVLYHNHHHYTRTTYSATNPGFGRACTEGTDWLVMSYSGPPPWVDTGGGDDEGGGSSGGYGYGGGGSASSSSSGGAPPPWVDGSGDFDPASFFGGITYSHTDRGDDRAKMKM
ncbi:unnamed protein product, partial [Laminaria digitata]